MRSWCCCFYLPCGALQRWRRARSAQTDAANMALVTWSSAGACVPKPSRNGCCSVGKPSQWPNPGPGFTAEPLARIPSPFAIRACRRCDCLRNMTGPSCSEPVSKAKRLCSYLGFGSLADCLLPKPYNCLNNCNERGTCFNGFCHCSEGAVMLRREPLWAIL